MLVIWGRSNSVNVQKVLWCCDEMEIAYRRVDAGGPFGVVGSAEYRDLNPNGLVPTIEDDGVVLWESNAIVRYLAAKHAAGTLWPTDLQRRAEGDRWMDWQTTTLWPALRPLFQGLIRTAPGQRDAQALEEARLLTAGVLRVADAHLATSAHVAGDTFSMGDIPLGCAIWRWMALPIERPPLPHVERWFKALMLRPAYARVVAHPLT